MEQSVITVFEDRRQKCELTPGQMNDILALRHILGENRLSLSWDGVLHVRHFVGFISKGKTRLQILPKIYENTGLSDEAEQQEAMGIMLKLLRVSEFNKILGLTQQSSKAEHSDIMEIFISIYADKVFQVYSRQMNREYITISENSTFIKGRIDFASNLRSNPIRRDRHMVSYQSYEHDNVINNIIKSVCIKLIKLTKEPDNKKKLKIALIFLDDAREVGLTKDLFDSVKFSRLNLSFKPVFDMAKMFFYNLTPQSYQGDDTVCSFLIPLNELFEYYLFKLFDAFGKGYQATYQNSCAFASCQKASFSKTVRPDILVKHLGQTILIADAKYKNPGYQNGKYVHVSQADIYQVFAYAKIYGVDSVALIYPQFDKVAPPTMMVDLKDYHINTKLVIGCIDIKNPDIEKDSAVLKEMFRFSEDARTVPLGN